MSVFLKIDNIPVSLTLNIGDTDNIYDNLCPYFYRAVHATVSVCLSVCNVYVTRCRDHIGWNTSKILSPPNTDEIVMWRFLRNRRLILRLYYFQGTHILGASRGGPCVSVASCYV